jgi:hypothetical protein
VLVLTMVADTIASHWGNSGFRISNLFSYFTIESNVFGGVVLLIAAAVALGRGPASPNFDYVRGAAALYLVITGLVYAFLLSGYDVVEQAAPTIGNLVFHRIMPVVLLLDWILDPPRIRLRVRTALWWLAFPLAYLAYTLIRGPIADWYPYPFIDPNGAGGYALVAVMCALVAASFIVFALLLVWLGNLLGSSRRALAPAPAE